MLSLAAPGKYLQGRNLIENISSHINVLGSKFAIICDEVVLQIIEEKINTSFSNNKNMHGFILFRGESTQIEAERIASVVIEKGYQVIVGIGGGKTIDTAKLAANILGLPLAVIPTVASSDAPCSAMSVIYDEDGTFIISSKMKRNPDMVLVDTEIISKAPVRTLVAGMGDAYATYYEARACRQSGAKNFSGGTATEAAYDMAALCRKLLLEYGEQAKESTEKKEWSTALERIVEANIYLSGVGFENNGCAIAHAVYSGMTSILKPFPVFHGEAVAFGTIVQLIAEGAYKSNQNELDETIRFYQRVGLPLTFGQMGIDIPTDKQIYSIAEATCTKSKNAYNMPFHVDSKTIFNALKLTL
ncbi:glycerol dehydrogenase [Sinanaerobacter chloroacetimidivorans]|uniref:Glycerol dehydrogenase n=1 Tax=Sinanaerobacter chloroacetimidivorans TaxID=2818044 RepID=A0A8J7VZ82_9FIRM|nr:glycerol dehydrogenase [Sinanaerobacter chloroacetimidivorans]MBR0597852.1 glycerol dehydrogenase [Sinanaerobacter chloroacetimidivorans]